MCPPPAGSGGKHGLATVPDHSPQHSPRHAPATGVWDSLVSRVQLRGKNRSKSIIDTDKESRERAWGHGGQAPASVRRPPLFARKRCDERGFDLCIDTP
eukprot:8479144-Pyramimonas_sp.AAC.3